MLRCSGPICSVGHHVSATEAMCLLDSGGNHKLAVQQQVLPADSCVEKRHAKVSAPAGNEAVVADKLHFSPNKTLKNANPNPWSALWVNQAKKRKDLWKLNESQKSSPGGRQKMRAA